MTVSTEVDHNEYTGNGVTTSFPYAFRVFNKSDLIVQVVDIHENITVLTLDTDYIVTGAGGYNGGNVILSKALANGYKISISRELPVTQETDLRNQGKFFAEVHEDAFDKLTMLIQLVKSMARLALRKPSLVPLTTMHSAIVFVTLMIHYFLRTLPRRNIQTHLSKELLTATYLKHSASLR